MMNKLRKCKCGCRQEIIWKSHHKYHGIPNYIHGHYLNVKNPMKNKETKEKMVKTKTENGFYKKCSKIMKSEKNPMKNTEIAKKHNERLTNLNKESEHYKKVSERMRINNPMFKKETREKQYKNMDFKEVGRKSSITIKKQYANGRQPPLPKGSKMEEIFGKEKSDKIKKNQSITRKQLFKEKEFQEKYYEAMKVKPNKPERLLIQLLNSHYPHEWKYVGNYKFWVDGKNPDFININGKKLLIELYGDYWHKDDDPQERINHFSKYGFNTLVIWERELKEIDLVLQRIKVFQNV